MRIKLNALLFLTRQADVWVILFPKDDKGKVDNQSQPGVVLTMILMMRYRFNG